MSTTARTPWLWLEAPFSAHRYTGSAHLLRRLVPGTRRLAPGVFHVPATARPDVLLTAVHATNHHRDGRPKPADRGTGALALWLAHRTGAGALVVLDAAGDANHDPAHPVKAAVAALVDVAHVLDLHGAAVGPVLDLGTGTGPTPPGILENLATPGTHVTVGARHAARHPHRVTTWAQRHGLTAVQLEIARTHRAPLGAPADVDHLATHLAKAIASTHREDPTQ
jgi:hypothetical protein